MIKLHTVSVPHDSVGFSKAIEKIRKYFLVEIMKPRTYKDYYIRYHSFDDVENDQERCFLKFAVGKPENHKTAKLDISRVKRLHWVHEILDYMIRNNFSDPNNRIIATTDTINLYGDEVNLYLVFKEYSYILIININKKIMLVSTAYVANEQTIDRYLRMRRISI